jgi:hypothetical protein
MLFSWQIAFDCESDINLGNYCCLTAGHFTIRFSSEPKQRQSEPEGDIGPDGPAVKIVAPQIRHADTDILDLP